MKRHLCLILIVLIGTQHAIAQAKHPVPVSTLQPSSPDGKMLPIFSASSKNAEKGTAVASRLIGDFYGLGRNSGVIRNSDSTAYSFSGNRGGDNNPTTVQYDSRTNYSWDTTTLVWKPTSRALYTFNDSNRLLTETDQNAVSGVWIGTLRYTYSLDASGADTLVQADTFNTASSSWKPYYAGHYTNNAAGKPLTVYYYLWSNTTSSYSGLIQRITYSYDGAGNNTGSTVELYTSSTGIWRNSYRYVFAYNAGGKQTLTSYQTWNTAMSTWGGALSNYYYNASNQKVAYSYQSSLTAASSDSANYTLDAAGNVLIENDFTKSGSVWTPSYRITATYSSTNKELTYIEEKYNAGSFQNYNRGFYFYNSFDQITREYTQSWSSGAWVINTNAFEERYYYENYNTVGITAVPKLTSNDLLIYPVPATTTMSVAISFAGQQSFTAVVTDAAGRAVLQWGDATNGGIYMHSIATGTLANGLYHLSIRGKNGVATRAFSVQH